jgi:type VI secretion system secreted protein Hcp
MALDMFIKIGNVAGESANADHKDSIDVLSWSWGASQAGSGAVGGGSGAGKVHIQDLHVTKYIDKSSATLFKMCCAGDHLPTALLTVRKAGGKALEYLKITMTQVLITSISTGGSSGGDDRLTESITLNFAKVKMEYTPQTDKAAGGATVQAGWDIAAGQAT